MREVKFRGRRIDNGEWVCGCLILAEHNDDKTHKHALVMKEPVLEHPTEKTSYEVDINTVGQFTGLYDKNGKEIYEGDLCTDEGNSFIEIVWSKNHQWGCKIVKGGVLSTGCTFPLWHWDRCKENNFRSLEIIGTIHDQKVEGYDEY